MGLAKILELATGQVVIRYREFSSSFDLLKNSAEIDLVVATESEAGLFRYDGNLFGDKARLNVQFTRLNRQDTKEWRLGWISYAEEPRPAIAYFLDKNYHPHHIEIGNLRVLLHLFRIQATLERSGDQVLGCVASHRLKSFLHQRFRIIGDQLSF